MAQTLIAIDVGTTRVRVVEFDNAFRSSRVADTYTIELEPEMEQAERWQVVRRELRRTPDSLIVSIDSSRVSTRILRFPFSDSRKIEAALDFELESQISYDLEDVVTSWTVTERFETGATVLAGVTPREDFVAALAALDEAELAPRAIALPAAALAELVPGNNLDPVAVLAIGGEQSQLAITCDGLRFARTLRTGSAAIDRRLAAHYRVSEDDARLAKEREACLLTDQAVSSAELHALSQQVELGLRPLLRELLLSFRSLAQGEQPTRLLLTGGGSRLPGLPAYLSERIGIPVELVDLRGVADTIADGARGSVETPPVSVSPEYAVAFAMGLAQLRRGAQVPLNFRTGEFRYSGDFAAYREEIGRVGLGIAAVVAIGLLSAVLRLSILSSEEQKLDQEFCETTEAIIGDKVCEPNRAISILKEPANAAGGVVIPTYSASDVLDALSGILGEDVDVKFEDLEITVEGRADLPDTVSGKAEADTFEGIEAVMTTLKRDPCVQKAEASRQRKTRDSGRVEFSVDIDIQCPEGVQPGAALAARDEL